MQKPKASKTNHLTIHSLKQIRDESQKRICLGSRSTNMVELARSSSALRNERPWIRKWSASDDVYFNPRGLSSSPPKVEMTKYSSEKKRKMDYLTPGLYCKQKQKKSAFPRKSGRKLSRSSKRSKKAIKLKSSRIRSSKRCVSDKKWSVIYIKRKAPSASKSSSAMFNSFKVKKEFKSNLLVSSEQPNVFKSCMRVPTFGEEKEL